MPTYETYIAMQAVLKVQQISKWYGAFKALDEVSFEVPAGSVFGILGPNGSGKTTLLGIVTDVLKASSGSYAWHGEPPYARQRKSIGTLLETPNFYPYLDAERNLKIAAAIKQCSAQEIDRVLKMVDLFEYKQVKFSSFSLGMKQRLSIGAALLGNPTVILLDEPTNGLDPEGISYLRDLLKQLNKAGKTIIMASHLLDEVEKTCTHVAILQKGKLLHSGEVKALLKEEDVVELSASNLQQLLEAVICFPGVVNAVIKEDNVLVFLPKDTARLDELNKYCQDRGILLQGLHIHKKSLETKFLELTTNK